MAGHPQVTHDVWHALYRRWDHHDRAGNRRRAAAWGWLTDRWTRLT